MKTIFPDEMNSKSKAHLASQILKRLVTCIYTKSSTLLSSQRNWSNVSPLSESLYLATSNMEAIQHGGDVHLATRRHHASVKSVSEMPVQTWSEGFNIPAKIGSLPTICTISWSDSMPIAFSTTTMGTCTKPSNEKKATLFE
jgi:hypothetical protein